MSRSDKYTVVWKTPLYYSDFQNNFDVNPLTGLLAEVTNEQSVGQSIRNLLLTHRYERYEQPTVGSKLTSLLFENFTPIVQEQLVDQITETIENNEPRATLIEVIATPDPDNNLYQVTIIYTLINIPQQIVLNVILRRIR